MDEPFQTLVSAQVHAHELGPTEPVLDSVWAEVEERRP